MPSAPDIANTELRIQLSPEHVQRLDELCAERNVTPGQLIAELLDKVKHRRGTERGAVTDKQRANPWGQVWPG